MVELKDPYEALKKLKKRLKKNESDLFDKGEIGILTASKRKKKVKKKK